MEYLPFGETLVEEHLNSNNSPYKFNAKELDEETGWYYYGARYYNPKWSIWLSVDPLAEFYPNWSPYNYTYNNPVRWTDSTGMCPDGDCPDPVVYDENKGIELHEVVITGSKNSPNKSSSMSFSGDMPDHMRYGGQPATWNTSFTGTLDDYNQVHGTNYTDDNSYNQWYYDNIYKPEFDEQISEMHAATSQAAELMMNIMPTPLAGGMLISKAPNLLRGAKAGYKVADDGLILLQTKGNLTLHHIKQIGIDKSYNFYKGLPANARRLLYPTQKCLLREQNTFRLFLNSQTPQQLNNTYTNFNRLRQIFF